MSEPESIEIIITAGDVIHEERVLAVGTRLALPREKARRLLDEHRARLPGCHRYVALANRLVATRGVTRGEAFTTEEPVDPEFVKQGLLLELAEGEEPLDPLPPDPTWSRDWKVGGSVSCVPTGHDIALLGAAARVGEILWYREKHALDHWFFQRVTDLRGLTTIGLAYMSQAKAARMEARPCYLRLARARRRAEPAPDPHDLGRLLKAVATRPVTIDGVRREPGRPFKAPEALLGPARAAGSVDVLSKPTPRFDAYVNALVEFYRNPDDMHPLWSRPCR
jgi:hypothetical protein